MAQILTSTTQLPKQPLIMFSGDFKEDAVDYIYISPTKKIRMGFKVPDKERKKNFTN